MKLTFLQLKKIIPELNRQVVSAARILQVFKDRDVEYHELPLQGKGCYVTASGRDYVFLRDSLTSLLFHETLTYEATHALCHYPAPFLLWRHNIEAEVLSLVMMMPLADLPRLNRIKHQLDDESFELLKRRNKANEVWKL